MPSPAADSLCGLDFGARTAGTTVVVWNGRDGRLHLRACPRQTDADAWLERLLMPRPPRRHRCAAQPAPRLLLHGPRQRA